MKKILIVEDEDYMSFRAIAKARDHFAGEYTIDIARSIPAAQNCLKRALMQNDPYYMIILDIMMNPEPYSLEETNQGLETGWIFYDRELRDVNSKIVVWSRKLNIFNKNWGANVIQRKRKTSSDSELIEMIEG